MEYNANPYPELQVKSLMTDFTRGVNLGVVKQEEETHLLQQGKRKPKTRQ
jgi:hypothetical protein